MGTALVRQPRVKRVPRPAGRAATTAFWLVGAALAGSFVLLTPFTVSHLLPGAAPSLPPAAKAPSAPTPPAPSEATAIGQDTSAPPSPAAASVEAAFTDLPIADEPPRQPPPTAPVGILATGLTRLVVPSAAGLPATSSAEFARPSLALPVAANPAPPAEVDAPSVGTIPAPRDALPLQTELIGPEQSGDGAPTRPPPTPSNRSDGSAATQRRG